MTLRKIDSDYRYATWRLWVYTASRNLSYTDIDRAVSKGLVCPGSDFREVQKACGVSITPLATETSMEQRGSHLKKHKRTKDRLEAVRLWIEKNIGQLNDIDKAWFLSALKSIVHTIAPSARAPDKTERFIGFHDALVIVQKYHTDKIYLKTRCPSPYPTSVSCDTVDLCFDAPHECGEDYVKKMFNIEPVVRRIDS